MNHIVFRLTTFYQLNQLCVPTIAQEFQFTRVGLNSIKDYFRMVYLTNLARTEPVGLILEGKKRGNIMRMPAFHNAMQEP
jgi:hypothetical protein